LQNIKKHPFSILYLVIYIQNFFKGHTIMHFITDK